MSIVRLVRKQELQIVVLHSPYDSLQTPEAQALFGALVGLKLKGYGCEYPYGVLPVDTTDFIATHIAIFRRSGNELLPVTAYKSISERKCRQHGVTFSGVQVPQSSGADFNVQAVQALIQKSEEHRSFLTYEGSWTIDPEIRQDPALIEEIHRIFTCMHVSQHLRYEKFDSICCGLLRFKTDRTMRGWGYSVLSLGGVPVQPFSQTSLRGENVQMFHTTRFSDEAMKTAEKYSEYWENRIEFGTPISNADFDVLKTAA